MTEIRLTIQGFKIFSYETRRTLSNHHEKKEKLIINIFQIITSRDLNSY